MVSRLGAENETIAEALKVLDMRSIARQPVFGDDQFELGVLLLDAL